MSASPPICDDSGSARRRFIVALAADSDVRIRDEVVPMRLIGVPTDVGPVDIVFRTRYSPEGFEHPVPRELWIDVRGDVADGPALSDVVTAYANAAAGFLPAIATSANAWVGDIEPKIAFEATPALAERSFFQNFVAEPQKTMPSPRRILDAATTVQLLQAVHGHPGRERLLRAIAQYALALSHWMPGRETLAMAHLFIGMEALTTLARDRELKRRDISAEELADQWGVADPRGGKPGYRLDSEVRRRILFAGDNATAKAAQEARNGFSHSFLDFKRVREIAEPIVNVTADYLRAAILDLSELDAKSVETLKSKPYDKPLRSFLTRYVWGTLLGAGEDLAAPDQEYPRLLWRSRLKSVRANPDDPDRLLMQPEDTITPSLADGISFQPTRWEIWGAAASGASVAEGQPDVDVSTAKVDPFAALAGEVDQLAAGLGGGEMLERAGSNVGLLATYDHCRHRHAAVLLLVKQGFSSEAIGIATAIFRDALLLSELASEAPESRADRVAGLHLDGLQQVDAWMSRIASSNGGAYESLEARARAAGAPGSSWTPDYEEIARSIGLKEDWATAQSAVLATGHPGLAKLSRFSRTADDTVMVGGPHANSREMDPLALLVAAAALLRASRAICTILGWIEPPKIAALLDTAAQLADSLNRNSLD
ncbi:hypothetical protein DVA67_011880 [Solirubrobacter sp. CPCC 204708]|uniref:Uncharacterized protein n=1 Tax=Solirubrobacter deserti TaxID=2282478 RepID=A0ABT4RLK2_9ACTN|nr:hypothetical protein [Solirubrobacter deserti]MBE2316677.1 hypothetical protein [Solirubrobacter deserti]MDA0139432.1 hypothetical protein [Solirubrobacter deserti]